MILRKNLPLVFTFILLIVLAGSGAMNIVLPKVIINSPAYSQAIKPSQPGLIQNNASLAAEGERLMQVLFSDFKYHQLFDQLLSQKEAKDMHIAMAKEYLGSVNSVLKKPARFADMHLRLLRRLYVSSRIEEKEYQLIKRQLQYG